MPTGLTEHAPLTTIGSHVVRVRNRLCPNKLFYPGQADLVSIEGQLLYTTITRNNVCEASEWAQPVADADQVAAFLLSERKRLAR